VFRVAHASHVLASASRRNNLSKKVREARHVCYPDLRSRIVITFCIDANA
jgi:hypothetical protein